MTMSQSPSYWWIPLAFAASIILLGTVLADGLRRALGWNLSAAIIVASAFIILDGAVCGLIWKALVPTLDESGPRSFIVVVGAVAVQTVLLRLALYRFRQRKGAAYPQRR